MGFMSMDVDQMLLEKNQQKRAVEQAEKAELPERRGGNASNESVVEAVPVRTEEQSVEPVEQEPEQAYRDSTELEPEIASTTNSGNGSSGTQVESDATVVLPKRSTAKSVTNKKQSQTTVKRIQSENVFVRDFPRDVAAFVRSEFPNATNNADALAAYVYIKSGKACAVPDSVKELAESWNGDKSLQNMDDRMTVIERQMRAFSVVLQELELGVSYMMFDRLGFRKDNPKDTRSVALLEDGVAEMMTRLREQTMQYRKQENIKAGRQYQYKNGRKEEDTE